ncbi:MAG: hypothetical protein IJ258_01035 [Methanobrevibacter sp.]|uniref:hypothetical protein n=1 Tax=Methanobrevibacter sp. TaxID=66852 RepID=UPI0025E3549B|nr:hypothetical protein [Methanobrevibacter sp.]MBQ8016668.1 hypothetical protein [Methanobrevibacter sp.]
MIEDNIRILRQAARVSSNNGYRIEKDWCIIAGNVDLVDDMAYKAIASNHKVKILFREHVILNEGKIDKKFDFIMLHGNALVLNEFKNETKQRGGAYVQVSKGHLTKEPNLMVLVAPDDVIRNIVSIIEKSKIQCAILQESQTTGFIDIDLNNEVKLPNFIKSFLKPFYNANEVVLSTILISIDKESDVNKVQSIATSNRVFVIDFRDIVTED